VTFSYAGPNAQGAFPTPKDEVRFLIEDQLEGPFSISDEDIAYYLVAAGQNVRTAAAVAARKRAGLYSATAKKQITVGPFSTTKDYSQNAADMRMLAASLADGTATAGGVPVVGLGDGYDDDQPPVFGIGMTDGAGFPERYR
jgi:hypothetical protein